MDTIKCLGMSEWRKILGVTLQVKYIYNVNKFCNSSITYIICHQFIEISLKVIINTNYMYIVCKS